MEKLTLLLVNLFQQHQYIMCLWVLLSPQVVFKCPEPLLLAPGFNGAPPECSDVSDGLPGRVVLVLDQVGGQDHPSPPVTSPAVNSYFSISRDLLSDHVNYLAQKVHIGSSKLFNEELFISHVFDIFE